MKALICELCGSNTFTKADDYFSCDYCRTKYTVEQAKKMMVEGVVQIDRSNDLTNLLDLASSASLYDNWGEAYSYATKALEVDPRSSWAWQIKGEAAGWLSTLSDLRLNEVIGAFERAVELLAPEEEVEGELRASRIRLQDATRSLNSARFVSITQSLYFLSLSHRNQFWSFANTVGEHGHRCELFVSALEIAADWSRAGGSDPSQPLVQLIRIVDDLAEKQKSDGFFNEISSPPFTSARLDAAREIAVKALSELDSSYVDPRGAIEASTSKSNGCFIVTATMGNEHNLPVETLREFRDSALIHSRSGRAFIEWYYKCGPSLAEWIRPSWPLRAATFIFVVIPAFVIAKIILAIRA